MLDFKVLNPNQVAQALGDVSVQQYLVSLRAIVAQKSVGLTNLFHLYAERIPVDTEKLAQTNPDIKNTNLFPEASPLKIDQYMATRRFNPEWQNIIR